MTKIETPTAETICRAIARNLAPVRAADVLDVVFQQTMTMLAPKADRYRRAVDRGLQAARKAGLATYDSKKGWRLTKAGRALCA